MIFDRSCRRGCSCPRGRLAKNHLLILLEFDSVVAPLVPVWLSQENVDAVEQSLGDFTDGVVDIPVGQEESPFGPRGRSFGT